MSPIVKEEDMVKQEKVTLDSLFNGDDKEQPLKPEEFNLNLEPSSLLDQPPLDDGKSTISTPIPSHLKSESPSSSTPYDDEDLKPGEPSSLPRKTPGRKKKGTNGGRETIPFKPTLIDDLPTAWDEAHATFESIDRCIYERKDLGLSREQDEMMVCDCVYDRDECRAGRHCRNQRLARRQYANVEIVQTEKKGFGLRAGSDLPAGSLVFEYIGEVVAEKTFRRRMAQYAEEGIKHFYFMMLQKEEYIDATKKGGIGRFANHSCNPNSEVQKWVVGRRMRMGIFTQRDVLKGEEITFNYNVDRYGHDAQICYCGEPNCVGTIGGKTQTDLGGMNTLFLDALGITDEVEEMGYKGNKKKKALHLDEDYIPTLHPIQQHEVSKVAAAIRQSMENNLMMTRLLQRIKMTEEPAVQRQLMRMHGFSLMAMILTEMSDERDIILLALEGMSKWKVTIRNKIEDSNIEEPVSALRDSADSTIAGIAENLLGYWATLELSYKIPRVSKIASLDAEDDRNTTTIAEANNDFNPYRRPNGLDSLANNTAIALQLAPVRVRPHLPPPRRSQPPLPPPTKPTPSTPVNTDKQKLAAIIALAQQSATPVPQGSSASPISAAAESSGSGSRPAHDEDFERRSSSKRPRSSSERAQEEERKARRLTKLVGEVVVKSMSKYKEQMEHETFKKYAKECTMTLVEKEKRGHSYTTSRHPHLSEEKKAKMKAFTKEFAHKILKKLKERGKLRTPRQLSISGDSHTSTPALTAVSNTALAELSGSGDGNGESSLSTPHSSANLLDEMFGDDDDFGHQDGGDKEREGDTDKEMDIKADIDIEPDSPSTVQTPNAIQTLMTNGTLEVGGYHDGKPRMVERVEGPFIVEHDHTHAEKKEVGVGNGPLILDHFGSTS